MFEAGRLGNLSASFFLVGLELFLVFPGLLENGRFHVFFGRFLYLFFRLFLWFGNLVFRLFFFFFHGIRIWEKLSANHFGLGFAVFGGGFEIVPAGLFEASGVVLGWVFPEALLLELFVLVLVEFGTDWLSLARLCVCGASLLSSALALVAFLFCSALT